MWITSNLTLLCISLTLPLVFCFQNGSSFTDLQSALCVAQCYARILNGFNETAACSRYSPGRESTEEAVQAEYQRCAIFKDEDVLDEEIPMKISKPVVTRVSPYSTDVRWVPSNLFFTTYLLAVTDELKHEQLYLLSNNSGMQFSNVEPCSKLMVRVAAVGPKAASLFSPPTAVPGPDAPKLKKPLQEVQYNDLEGLFEGNFTWQPENWRPQDILGYELNQVITTCKDTDKVPMTFPSPLEMLRKPDTWRFTVDSKAFDNCQYKVILTARSRCKTVFGTSSFSFSLGSDCGKYPTHPSCTNTRPLVTNAVGGVNCTLSGKNKILVSWRHAEPDARYITPASYLVRVGDVLLAIPGLRRYTITTELARIKVDSDTQSVEFNISTSHDKIGIQVIALKEGAEASETDYVRRAVHVFQLSKLKKVEDYSESIVSGPGGKDSKTGLKSEESGPSRPVKGRSLALTVVIPSAVVACLFAAIATFVRSDYFRRLRRKSNDDVFVTMENDAYEGRRQRSCKPPQPDRWEVRRSRIVVGRVLGAGAFGQVSLATVQGRLSQTFRHGSSTCDAYNRQTDSTTVAVKLLHDDASEIQRDDFLKEIQLMKRIGHHKHLVNMIGCCTLGDEAPALLVEHVPHGDLLTFLRSRRRLANGTKLPRRPIPRTQSDLGVDNPCFEVVDKLTYCDMLGFARQVALGMEFVSQQGFVHRDLAARNVLVGINKTVKIGDFGLTRYTYDDAVYVARRGGKLPLRWMSIEAILELCFSTQSDVWSYGVLLFEIITFGGIPYPGMANRDIPRWLVAGNRLEKPEHCPEDLYCVMLSCWNTSPEDRPNFSQLLQRINDLLESAADYVPLCAPQDSVIYARDMYGRYFGNWRGLRSGKEPSGEGSSKDLSSAATAMTFDSYFSELGSMITSADV